ncbi:DUF6602 domain-containing protein [Flavobacterium psychrophilum]|uniref:DUF6602 domain-containing protein n=1 Tax=Flavobacterium psychrophilum TaxID=96345 RepID=UPI00293D492F|nr:DUF6602 domain-containing protein [Flavobacterium psychrophilum]
MYKEIVLKNIIRRFLPEKYKIGTGFVVTQTENRGEHNHSTQIDLLIYDDASPILFKEGDFVILTPDSVRGIIEVKSNIQNVASLKEVVNKSNKIGQTIYNSKTDKKQKFFNGIFSYDGYLNNFGLQTLVDNYLEGISDFSSDTNHKKFIVNHVSFNKNLFLKLWPSETNPHSLYNIEDLSFSFFISNLIDTLANSSVKRNSFIWYAADKELNILKQF